MYGNRLNHTYGSPGAHRQGLVYVSAVTTKPAPDYDLLLSPGLSIGYLSNTNFYFYLNNNKIVTNSKDPASVISAAIVTGDYPLVIIPIINIEINGDSFSTRDFLNNYSVYEEINGVLSPTTDFYLALETLTVEGYNYSTPTGNSFNIPYIVLYQKSTYRYTSQTNIHIVYNNYISSAKKRHDYNYCKVTAPNGAFTLNTSDVVYNMDVVSMKKYYYTSPYNISNVENEITIGGPIVFTSQYDANPSFIQQGSTFLADMSSGYSLSVGNYIEEPTIYTASDSVTQLDPTSLVSGSGNVYGMLRLKFTGQTWQQRTPADIQGIFGSALQANEGIASGIRIYSKQHNT